MAELKGGTYVGGDIIVANNIIAGGTLSTNNDTYVNGVLYTNGKPNTGDQDLSNLSTYTYVDGTFLKLAGGTMTGNLTAPNYLRSDGATIWHSGNFTNLNQLTTRNFNDLQNKPTTLSEYGITNAYTKDQTNATYVKYSNSVDGTSMNVYKGSEVLNGSNMTDSAIRTISNFIVLRYSNDWGTQLQFVPSNRKSYVRFWRDSGGVMDSTWKEFAYIDSNVASATKLSTSRTIWGQTDTDGTGNVSGALTGVSTISASGNITTSGIVYTNGKANTGDQDLSNLATYDYVDNNFLNLTGGTLSGNLFIPNYAAIIQNQGSTSNYTTAIKWYKGGVSQNIYDPQIGQHNEGGGTGSIVILPYPTNIDPWNGTVGLYLTETVVKFNSNNIYHSGNFTNLNQLTTRNFSDIQNKPTTIDGYQITDGVKNNGGLWNISIKGRDNTAGNALLQSGSGRSDDESGSTWLFWDTLGGSSAPWGIKHNQAGNYIEYYGNGLIKTYIDLNNGYIYTNGKANTGDQDLGNLATYDYVDDTFLPISGGTMTGNLTAPNYLRSDGATIWHSGNDGAGSGLDADTLDGLNSSSYFKTNGGLKKNFNDASTLVDNSTCYWTPETVGSPNGTYGVLMGISDNIGLYYNQLGFGVDTRIYFRQAVNSTTNFGAWNTLAFISDNVESATKLQTARTIWGQNFDGTGNVSGAMTGVSTISASGNITTSGIVYTNGKANTGDQDLGNLATYDYVDDTFLPISGGTMTGNLTAPNYLRSDGATVWHSGNDGSGSGLDADLLDGFQSIKYLPYGCYHNNLGILVTTEVPATSDTMFIIKIIGNDYSGGDPKGIDTTVQFYNYSSGDSIINRGGTNNGSSFGDIKVFNYNNKVCIWFQQANAYQTYKIFAYTHTPLNTTPNYNAVESITNEAMPTTGVTREVTITPKQSALITDNVASATKLQTARTLWGQNFDGTGNVSGAMTGVSTISASGTITAPTFSGALSGNASTTTQLQNTRTIWGQNFNGTGNVSGALTGVSTISASGTVTAPTFSGAFSGNASTSTKLATARTIWGQNFDGTGNVSGAMTGVSTINASGIITGSAIQTSNNSDYSLIVRNSTAPALFVQSSVTGATQIASFRYGSATAGGGTSVLDIYSGSVVSTVGYSKSGSSDSEVLLGGGGTCIRGDVLPLKQGYLSIVNGSYITQSSVKAYQLGHIVIIQGTFKTGGSASNDTPYFTIPSTIGVPFDDTGWSGVAGNQNTGIKMYIPKDSRTIYLIWNDTGTSTFYQMSWVYYTATSIY